jgi:hypothetical protein
VRDRPFVYRGLLLSLTRLQDLRQVSACENREEARRHSLLKRLPIKQTSESGLALALRLRLDAGGGPIMESNAPVWAWFAAALVAFSIIGYVALRMPA